MFKKNKIRSIGENPKDEENLRFSAPMAEEKKDAVKKEKTVSKKSEKPVAKKEKIINEKKQPKEEIKSKKIIKAKEAHKEVEKEVKPVADPFNVIRFVLMTEKAIQNIEKQNKLVFIVMKNAEKGDIKAAVEGAFKAPVENVHTLIDQKSRKKAIVKFKQAGIAGEIAIRLGII